MRATPALRLSTSAAAGRAALTTIAKNTTIRTIRTITTIKALAATTTCVVLAGVAVCTLAVPAHAQTATAAVPVLAGTLFADQAAQDVRVLTRALTALHPALTKYLSQGQVDAAFAAFEKRGNAARNASEMYLAATALAASIRCGHTWTNVRNQQGLAQALLLDAPNKLPITLSLVENRWLVLASATPEVVAGDEVMAINGLRTPDLIAKLMPYLRADGSSDGKRLRQLSHDRFDFSQMDVLLPLVLPPEQGQYRMGVRRASGQERDVSAGVTTLAARAASLKAQGVPVMDEAWTFRIHGQVGYLTLPSFSFWNSKFDWAQFLEESFAQLRAKAVPNLIIDIRDNEGGDGAIGLKLASYISSQPVSYLESQSVTTYERVPYPLVRYLDTWDYSFFDRTGDVQKITTGTAAGKFMVTSRPVTTNTVQPAANPYGGKVVMLVGAENSSATFLLADIVQRNRLATLVGQRTGGNQRGLNGGQLTWVVLPNSGVSVDIPLLAATYTTDTPDTSVTPEVVVLRTFAARAAGIDQELQAALKFMGTP